MSKVLVFVPTYNKYQISVYKYRGLNEYNQIVMDQYILEANVGDPRVPKGGKVNIIENKKIE